MPVIYQPNTKMFDLKCGMWDDITTDSTKSLQVFVIL